MDGEIEMSQEHKDGVLVVTLKGRLDAVTSPQVEKDIAGLVDGGEHKVLLHFGGVTYLSSAGMRMLLATTKKLKMLEGSLVVTDVDDRVMDVLKMSGFDHVIDLAATEEEGLKKFQG